MKSQGGWEMNECGNENHPNGKWHEATPYPASWNLIERIRQWFRRKKFGCGCKVTP